MSHDSVYDSRASDNEERSGILWMRDAAALGFSTEEAEQGNEYILATHPSATPISVLNDMDLAELGAPPEVFDQNTENIRKEYRWVEPEVWRSGRQAILTQFLHRDKLYITPEFADKFTLPAIENLKRAVLKLSNPSVS
jgi:predicted metal-dependent HD superfamily phosphohydrolase